MYFLALALMLILNLLDLLVLKLLHVRVLLRICVLKPVLVLTSWIASPTSQSCTSMPAVRMPVSVASFTASSNGSNVGSNATVHAQSIIRPGEIQRVRQGDYDEAQHGMLRKIWRWKTKKTNPRTLTSLPGAFGCKIRNKHSLIGQA